MLIAALLVVLILAVLFPKDLRFLVGSAGLMGLLYMSYWAVMEGQWKGLLPLGFLLAGVVIGVVLDYVERRRAGG